MPATITTHKYLIPLLWILALEAMGAGIGFVTASHIDSWYDGLNRAPLNPPSWAFGVMWPALYALIAVAGWRIWSRRHQPKMKLPLILFALQMVMNGAWSFIFFTYHLLWPAYIEISALVIVVALLIILLWKKDRISAYLLLPYLLWISFATYLSGYIAAYNP